MCPLMLIARVIISVKTSPFNLILNDCEGQSVWRSLSWVGSILVPGVSCCIYNVSLQSSTLFLFQWMIVIQETIYHLKGHSDG